MRSPNFYLSMTVAVLAAFAVSCGGDTDKTTDNNDDKAASSKSKNESSLLKVGDKLFNLPSPLETAFLIEEVGGHFTETMLNPAVDATRYSTKNEQAMNLGIYGADLGYCLIYGQSQKAFSLLAACKKLGTQLGISPALYADLMKRFEGNMENRDSLLIFISELNRLSDEYLKENESEDVSALILYGGWVESLYFTTTLSSTLKSEALRARVGDQKNSLENLIGLMQQQNASGDLDQFITSLQDLKTTFDKVEYSYEWIEPETDPAQKLTVIKSKSKVMVSDEVLQEIHSKVTTIRNSIIGTTA